MGCPIAACLQKLMDRRGGQAVWPEIFLQEDQKIGRSEGENFGGARCRL